MGKTLLAWNIVTWRVKSLLAREMLHGEGKIYLAWEKDTECVKKG